LTTTVQEFARSPSSIADIAVRVLRLLSQAVFSHYLGTKLNRSSSEFTLASRFRVLPPSVENRLATFFFFFTSNRFLAMSVT